MEKYLMLANDKAEKLNLRRTRDLRQAFSSMEPIKSIDVLDKGRMKVFKIKGDGNCQFKMMMRITKV
jgi:hypothetical protein